MLDKFRSFSSLILLSTALVVNTSYAQDPAMEKVEQSDTTVESVLVEEISNKNVELTAFNLSTTKSNVAEGSKVQLEFMISHPSYKVLSLNTDKSIVKSIFVYDEPPRDVLTEARKRQIEEEEKQKDEEDSIEQRGIFSYSGCLAGDTCKPELLEGETKDGNLYVSFRNNVLGLESMRNLWVKAEFYVMAALEGQEAGETVIKDVGISNTVPSKIANDTIAFSILANGNIKGSEEGSSYGFNITDFNKYVKSIRVVNLDDEVVLATIENEGNSFYINEEYLGKPISVVVTYYDLEEYMLQFNQYVISK